MLDNIISIVYNLQVYCCFTKASLPSARPEVVDELHFVNFHVSNRFATKLGNNVTL